MLAWPLSAHLPRDPPLHSVWGVLANGLAFPLQRGSPWHNSHNPPARNQRGQITQSVTTGSTFLRHPPVPVTLAGIIVRNQICSCCRSAAYHLCDLPHPLPKTHPSSFLSVSARECLMPPCSPSFTYCSATSQASIWCYLPALFFFGCNVSHVWV